MTFYFYFGNLFVSGLENYRHSPTIPKVGGVTLSAAKQAPIESSLNTLLKGTNACSSSEAKSRCVTCHMLYNSTQLKSARVISIHVDAFMNAHWLHSPLCFRVHGDHAHTISDVQQTSPQSCNRRQGNLWIRAKSSSQKQAIVLATKPLVELTFLFLWSSGTGHIIQLVSTSLWGSSATQDPVNRDPQTLAVQGGWPLTSSLHRDGPAVGHRVGRQGALPGGQREGDGGRAGSSQCQRVCYLCGAR